MPHKTTADEFMRALSSASIPTPMQQNKIEVRIMALYITLSFVNDLIGPITYVLGIAPSVLYRAATMSHGPWFVGGLFLLSLLLVLPHAFVLVFMPSKLSWRWPRLMATGAATAVMITWGFLAVEAYRLDMGPLHWLYARQGVFSMALALIYAVSLNAQLLRDLYDRYHKQ